MPHYCPMRALPLPGFFKADPDRAALLAGPLGPSLNATRDAEAVGLLLTGEPGPPAALLLLTLPPRSNSAAL
jgi:hypothetical protein